MHDCNALPLFVAQTAAYFGDLMITHWQAFTGLQKAISLMESALCALRQALREDTDEELLELCENSSATLSDGQGLLFLCQPCMCRSQPVCFVPVCFVAAHYLAPPFAPSLLFASVRRLRIQ